MPSGAGKYDILATWVMEIAEARAVIVIVLDGNRGSGFSMQSRGLSVAHLLPTLLRQTADEIERDTGEEPPT
jgi:hypothetical protein